MKTKRYILGILLAVACSIQMAGQTLVNGEAFYIYRNDGDFNGFFYDQVKDMRYSKLDLAGNEFDEFVVQEIETADSLYRIPLCAIDSIGFVQPAIEINPKLRIMEDEGWDKCVSRCSMPTEDTYSFQFYILNGNVPEVGDIIVSDSFQIGYTPRGIACKVTKVTEFQRIYTVEGVAVTNLGDIFNRFITTEYITADENGQPVRRMAGLDKIAGDAGSASFNLLNLEGTLTREYEQTENSNLAITIDYGVRVGIQVTYDITMDHVFVKLGMDEDLTAQAGFSGTISGTWEPEFSLLPDWVGAIKFPACLPLFETNVLPRTFFRIGGSVGVKSTLPSVNFKAKQLVIISDRTGNWLNCNASSNITSGYGDDDTNLIQPGDSQLTFNGFVQTGIKFDNSIKTNSWASRIFQSSIGLETYVGPKLSGNIDLSLPELAEGEIDYSILKNTYVTFSPCTADIEAKASVKAIGYPEESVKFAEGSYSLSTDQRSLLVKFNDIKVTQDDDYKSVTLDLSWDGKVLFGQDIGIAIFKINEDYSLGAEVARSDMKYYFSGDKAMQYTPKLKPGYYKAIPIVKFLDGEIKAKSCATIFEIMPTVEFSAEKVELDAWGKTENDSVSTVITYTTDGPVKVYCRYCRGFSIKHDPETKKITITAAPNLDLQYHEGSLTIDFQNVFGVKTKVINIPIRQKVDINVKEVLVRTAADTYAPYKKTAFSSMDGETTRDEKFEANQDVYLEAALDDWLTCSVTQKGDKLYITAMGTEKYDSNNYDDHRNKIIKMNLEMRLFDREVFVENFTYDYDYSRYAESHLDKTTETENVQTMSIYDEKESTRNGSASWTEQSGHGYIGFSVPTYECPRLERHYNNEERYTKYYDGKDREFYNKTTEDITGTAEDNRGNNDSNTVHVSIYFKR